VFKREQYPELEAFDRGCLTLSRDGVLLGHVATAVSPFWSPGRPLTIQQRVWLVVVWADGKKEWSEEDYPPWTYVREIGEGKLEWPYPGPREGVYEVAWLVQGEREAKLLELGVTDADF